MRDVSGTQSLWRYARDRLPLGCYWRYAKNVFRARRPPPFRELKPVAARDRWIVYFLYSPDGKLEAHHHYALRRLRAHDAGLLVVFASADEGQVPTEVRENSDACFWKGPGGYDFSAYTIALRAIADKSPGADVLVMNDSVFGPISDLTPFFDKAPWDLTGFTGSDGSNQRHIQSYAFILKDVTPRRLHDLRWIFSPHFAFNNAFGAISCQELWMSRFAARTMSVGSFWYAGFAERGDISLTQAVELVEAGMPFLKRSLTGKHNRFQNDGDVDKLIVRIGCDTAPID